MKNDEAPWPLARFRAAYQANDNLWWTLGCGHHQNLFEDACEQLDAAVKLAEVHRLSHHKQIELTKEALARIAEFERECYERSLEQQDALARIAAVEAWAAKNEIAAPPLDWEGLGAILHGAAAPAATPGRATAETQLAAVKAVIREYQDDHTPTTRAEVVEDLAVTVFNRLAAAAPEAPEAQWETCDCDACYDSAAPEAQR